MRLGEIYNLVVKKGLDKDPRTGKELREQKRKLYSEYNKLKGMDKKFFDKERFRNPFADTRILFGDINKDIRTIMVGIDAGAAELLTAYMLKKEGRPIDLVMSHHPSGRALSNLHHVMGVHVNVLHRLGIDLEIAKSLVEERMGEVSRRFSSMNSQRNVDIARLLNIPLMCVHTPADNHVTHFLQNMFNRKKPKTVSQALNILKRIPEYQTALSRGAGPRLILGQEKKKAGKIFVDMTGGTEGSNKVFPRLSQAGVSTIVGMHLSEEHYKRAKDEHINVIVAGHIASDTLGLNLVLDEVMRKEKLKIIPCSGFFRVVR